MSQHIHRPVVDRHPPSAFSAEAALRVVHRLDISTEEEILLAEYIQVLKERHSLASSGAGPDQDKEVAEFPESASWLQQLYSRAVSTPLEVEKQKKDEWTLVVLGSLPLEQVIAHVQEQVG